MKKVLGGIILLVLVLLMGAPWYIGKQVETFYTQLTDESLMNNPSMGIKDLDYQRGWFSSVITGDIILKAMGEDLALPAVIRFKSEVTHGPVFWSALSSGSPIGLALDRSSAWIEPVEESDPELAAIIKEFPSFEMKSHIGFDKTIASVYSIAAYAKTFKETSKPVVIDFAGLNGNGTYNWASKDFDFEAEMPSFSITENEADVFIVDKILLSAAKAGGDTSARYDIERIAFNNKISHTRFNLDKAYVAAMSKEAEEVYNSTFETGFDNLTNNDLSFAPAKLEIMLDNLDKASMDTLRETINDVAASGSMNSDMYGMMIMGKLMELLPEILKRDPKFTLTTLNLGTGKDEALTATGYAEILGEQAANLPSMTMLIQAVNAEFEASLPKAFLNTFMDLGQLMQLMDQGLLVSDENYYRTKATIKEGHVTINGNTIM
ncbi:DUF945 family protein [Desulfoluna butyratoxydans]|uniref:DUF945 domain-containing protein n=1 Tax=Desulfoluna butyratoxydans TaxID=231438 RepID=A0A4V6YUC2_9BACT|nr:DUF945 family protein [Desulfoluna butyratoxydans]VFQ43328.1 protein of unknown function duf945 [Desulfoluna butyratoxydans]